MKQKGFFQPDKKLLSDVPVQRSSE